MAEKEKKEKAPKVKKSRVKEKQTETQEKPIYSISSKEEKGYVAKKFTNEKWMAWLKTGKWAIPVVVVVIAILMVVSTVLMTTMINNMVFEQQTDNMVETSEYNVQTLNNFSDTSYKNLKTVVESIKLNASTYDTDSLKAYLTDAAKATDFSSILICDKNNKILTSNGYIGKESALKIFATEKDGTEKAISFTNDNYAFLFNTMSKDALIYCVPMDNISIDGNTYDYLLGQVSLNDLKESLNIYQGEGNVSLVNSNGYYLFTFDDAAECIYDEENFTSLYIDEDKIKNSIEKGTKYLTSLDDTNETSLVYIEKVDSINAVLYSVVPYSVFEVEAQGYHKVIHLAILIITVVIVLLLLLTALAMIKRVQVTTAVNTKSEFLSNMSHELRTPVNGIIGLNHLISKNKNDPKKLDEYIAKLDATSEYIMSLFNDMQDINKVREGDTIHLTEKPTDLNVLIDSMSSAQATVMRRKKVNFGVHKEITNPYILTDDIRLEQILENILDNACKFTQPNGAVIMNIKQAQAGNNQVTTTYEIRDTGCGMNAETISHIFEAYTQDRMKTTVSQKGTGLGLAIVYNLVKEMGGEIKVESKEGYGSKFTIKLTTKVCTKEDFNKQEGKTTVRDGDSKINILVAEDNELNADILTEILHESGFNVTLAINGKECLEKYIESGDGEYDVILMDMQMPIMNGCEAAEAIRALKRKDAKTVKIFACTANAFDEDKDMALKSGMNDFVTKPVDIDILIEKIHKWQEK